MLAPPWRKRFVVGAACPRHALPLQACKANRWATLSLTGDLDARKRQALVDEFNSPAHPSFVLLLSSKAGGVSAGGAPHRGHHAQVLPLPPIPAVCAVWSAGRCGKPPRGGL